MSEMEMVYDGLLHDCERPSTAHLPRYGERRQVMAKWRCPECRQRWHYAASFLNYERMYWVRFGFPSRRWRKAEAEAARLAALAPRPSAHAEQEGE